MKDNNKKIIIAIIAVATIIVAIIGATFAFFSASGGSANNAVTANATTLSNLGFTSSHSKIATNLVPVSSESPYFSRYPGIAASGEHSCLDDVGNEICSIYEFTVTNTASVAQTIYVSFVPSENTFDNMYFAAFNTTIASANYEVATGSNGSGNNFTLTPQTTSGNSTLGHQATKLTKNSTSPIDMPGLSTNLGAGGSITYTILIWIQETKNEQNTEQGGTFKAGINVTTGGSSTGVTGVMGGGSTVYTANFNNPDVFGYNQVWIGQPISNSIIQYSTASSAMANNNNYPLYLKHTIGNYSGYCMYEKDNETKVETGYYYCLSDFTQSSCETKAFEMENNNGYTYECRYNEASNVVTKSYVVFEVTSEMALANSGMSAGTYELQAGDGGASYSTNVSTLTNAFGSSNCSDYSSYVYCNVSGLRVYVYSNGYVSARISGGIYCSVQDDGSSSFEEM